MSDEKILHLGRFTCWPLALLFHSFFTMKLKSSLAGGLAGAITVIVIHQVLNSATKRRKWKKGQWMIAGVDLAAGLVSAAVMHCLENRKRKPVVSPFNPPVESYKPVVDITV